MKVYADVGDLLALGKSLTAQQREAAEVLLAQASAKLRLTAQKYGKDIDKMIDDHETGDDYKLAVQAVVMQAVCRALDSLADASAAVSQGSESVGAYSISMTYLNAGQSLYFLRNELKDLGLLRQTVGWLNMYGEE